MDFERGHVVKQFSKELVDSFNEALVVFGGQRIASLLNVEVNNRGKPIEHVRNNGKEDARVSFYQWLVLASTRILHCLKFLFKFF